MTDKMNSLVRSRRFWAAVGALVFVVADTFGLGLEQETVVTGVAAIAAWILGDSLRKTE